jgi:hypothetical protein
MTLFPMYYDTRHHIDFWVYLPVLQELLGEQEGGKYNFHMSPKISHFLKISISLQQKNPILHPTKFYSDGGLNHNDLYQSSQRIITPRIKQRNPHNDFQKQKLQIERSRNLKKLGLDCEVKKLMMRIHVYSTH